MDIVVTEIAGNIAIVRVNNPPVNALSQVLRAGLLQAAEAIDADDRVAAAVLICEGRTFIAGADIREFDAAPLEPGLPAVIDRIETSTKPWVAALHGTALGGGLEIALGCHYRVALASAKVGLPEVNLGILPGAGGTIRLPRATSAGFALDMITSGKLLSVGAAAQAGMIDALVPQGEDLEAFALAFARGVAGAPLPAPLSAREPAEIPDDEWWRAKIEEIERGARGRLAPVEAAKIVRNGFEKPFTQALADERACFMALKEGEQAKAMRYAFFAEREIARVPFVKGVEARDIARVAVVGGGTMGAGISAAALLNGFSVAMIERDEASARNGGDRVLAILDSSVKRGLLSPDRRDEAGRNFSASCDYACAGDADLAIEAVFEDMAVKKAVFCELDKATRVDCILASNTSYLDVNEIAAAVSDPSRVLGLHFFSPAHVMKLVEVIRTDAVSPEAYATGFAFARKLGKQPVYSGVCDGFIGNRIIYQYRRVCDYMLEDGAMPHEIDAAMRAFGMAMGPYEMGDMAGLDLGYATRRRKAATRDPGERYVRIADRVCELGRYGQKTGAGWYSYANGPRKGERDPVVEEIVLEESAANGIERRGFTAREIQQTVVGAMAAEGRKILEEGIALRSSDIDMVMVLGYGFPRWRGGPIFMSENGLA